LTNFPLVDYADIRMISEPLPQTLIERAAKSSRRKTAVSVVGLGSAVIDALFVESLNEVTEVCASSTCGLSVTDIVNVKKAEAKRN